jgi:hypothetical protein
MRTGAEAEEMSEESATARALRLTAERVFELALQRLHIAADDEAAKRELAKLVLDIAAPSEEDLLDKIEVAWGWRHPRQG